MLMVVYFPWQDVPNLRYSIVASANNDYTNFYVDPLTGLITLKTYLDSAGNNQNNYTVSLCKGRCLFLDCEYVG